MPRSDILFDLGRIGESERWAHDALAARGPLPAILERLALINVVKGRPEAARTFLRALGRTLFHRRRARELLRRLDSDPGLAGDPAIERSRSL